MTTRQPFDTPVAPAAITLPLAIGFVLLRWDIAASRRLGWFVGAASRYVNGSKVPIPVGVGPGYDGQFYYRIGLDPFDFSRYAFGIRFDTISRIERIGYPLVAWLVAFGHRPILPLTLVVTNVVAATVVGLAGGLLAQSAGRHALWGLVFSTYWGYLWTLGRDLTELTAAALFLLGLAALLRNAPVWGGLALLGAVLTKETVLLLVGALFVQAVWERYRTGEWGPRRADAAWAVPVVGTVIWQLFLLSRVGSIVLLSSGNANLGPPFLGLLHGMRVYAAAFPSVPSALWWGELCALVLVTVGAATTVGRAPSTVRFLWSFAVGLGLCAASGIWLGDVGFRSLDSLYLTGWIILLYGARRLWPWAVLCAGAWCVVAIELIRFL